MKEEKEGPGGICSSKEEFREPGQLHHLGAESGLLRMSLLVLRFRRSQCVPGTQVGTGHGSES